MERFIIFCCTVLSVVSVTNAAMCISTVDCPNNGSPCVLNCSAIAVHEFDRPASHGNCRLSVTLEANRIHSCYIDECNTSHPEICVPQSEEGVTAACCCTEDYCNNEFTLAPNGNTTDSSPTMSSPTISGPTNDSVNITHIYPTYPTHVSPDELVCLHQTCKNDDCITQYEVCSEDPIYANTPAVRSTCYAVFIVNAETGNVTSRKQCLDDPDSECPEKCIPEQHGFITGLHDCCCIGNLCNDVNATDGTNETDISPTPHPTTDTLKPTSATPLLNSTIPLPSSTTTPRPTNDSVNITHIYPTYPTHVSPDELVCLYQNCTNGDCGIRYEVCSESQDPLFANLSITSYACYTLFSVDTNTDDVIPLRRCINKLLFHSCPEKCTLGLHPADRSDGILLYDCCCTGNLCNYVAEPTLTSINVAGSHSTAEVHATIEPRSTIEPLSTPKATSDDDDDDQSNYIPLIYGIAAGVCLLIVLVLMVILTLAYCHFHHDRTINCSQCINYNQFGNS